MGSFGYSTSLPCDVCGERNNNQTEPRLCYTVCEEHQSISPVRVSRAKHLRSFMFIIGKRNPRLNTDYPGSQMVVEMYEESELPTRDGRDGPWCVVGDDLGALIDEAYDFLVSLTATQEKEE